MPGLAHKLPQEISFVREVLSGATPAVGRWRSHERRSSRRPPPAAVDPHKTVLIYCSLLTTCAPRALLSLSPVARLVTARPFPFSALLFPRPTGLCQSAFLPLPSFRGKYKIRRPSVAIANFPAAPRHPPCHRLHCLPLFSSRPSSRLPFAGKGVVFCLFIFFFFFAAVS